MNHLDVCKLHARLIKTCLHHHPLSIRPVLLACAADVRLPLPYALSVFHSLPSPDTFSWNTIIRAHINRCSFSEAIRLFVQMRNRNVAPDYYTFPFLLKGCAHLTFLQTGKQLHSLTLKLGLNHDIFVQNALINFYSSLEFVETALQVFDEMTNRDLVTWSTLITGFTNNGLYENALRVFRDMQVTTFIRPDEVTMLSVIAAVSSLGALELGKWVHFFICKNGFKLTISLGTALIVMYSRCGFIEGSVRIFYEMHERNLLTWTALIDGYAVHGQSKKALEAFNEMKECGFQPDYITFVGVLAACSHGGLLEEGKNLFDSIRRDYEIEPGIEHYGCMVDLLGRAGLLNEAYEFIERMPIRPGSIIWRTLLGACANYNDVDMAEQVKKRISEFDPYHDGDYVLLSNVYGGLGRWVEKEGVRNSMRKKGIGKRPGCSLIELNQVIHEFVSWDDSHPQSENIKEMLALILERLKVSGYSPDTSNVLFDIDEEEKEQILSYHSEKLAVAFALLRFDHTRTIRIVKNLRICRDCHSFMKLLSKAFDREVIIRDRNRFHHFQQGTCSCRDYW